MTLALTPHCGYRPKPPAAVRLRSVPLAERLARRVMDVAGAAGCLIVSAPLLAACALWVGLVDGGPVIYTQWRVGHRGRLFRIYKLRTMAVNAEQDSGVQFAKQGDPRILIGCAWMRKTHIDELPQLVNILLGHMSLVGPRPERPEIFEELRGVLPRIEQRLAVRPGLTGLAQVRNGYTNDEAGARRKLAYDLCYLRRQSLTEDLRLIIQTIPKVWDPLAL